MMKKNGVACYTMYLTHRTKYTKKELLNMNPVDIYKMVLKGDIIKRFPSGFWSECNGIENAKSCTKFLIEEILKLDENLLKQELCSDLFIKNKLGGMLLICFGASPFKAIDSIYPGKYNPWDFNIAPSHLWKDKKNGIKATKWLIEEKLKLNEDELKEKLSRDMFEENGLRGMLRHCFEDSPYKAINSTYPNKYQKNDFKNYYIKMTGKYRNGKK
ncbi:MAG: hypothetical protein IJH34_11395 [Romboutsia sp.]|nr:hypothetical protein [Romboutsia sp.]